MVKIDVDKCVGCGACADFNSEIFEIVNGKAKVKEGQESNPDGEKAIGICPVGAINK